MSGLDTNHVFLTVLYGFFWDGYSDFDFIAGFDCVSICYLLWWGAYSETHSMEKY